MRGAKCKHEWAVNVHERICLKCRRREVNLRHGEKYPKWVQQTDGSRTDEVQK